MKLINNIKIRKKTLKRQKINIYMNWGKKYVNFWKQF